MLSTCTRIVSTANSGTKIKIATQGPTEDDDPEERKATSSAAFSSTAFLSSSLMTERYIVFFARGMPQKWRKSKPEIYASFNCCSCMRFKAKAIIVRSCVASPLGTGALDTSALAAPMACNGRMSRKNKKNTTPKKFP